MKVCCICNEKKSLKEYYFKNLKRVNGENYKYFEGSCKDCYINKAKKNYKTRTPKQVMQYAKQKNISRKIRRRKKSADKLGISYGSYLIYIKMKKEISTKRKLIKDLKSRLNKFNPKLIKKDSNWYKEYYKISTISWKELTKDKPKEVALIYRIRYKYDTEFNLNERLKNQIKRKSKKYPYLDNCVRQAVKKQTNSKYFKILGYTRADLKNYLEKQFTKDMTWKAFRNGDIHIDHIKPQSLFNLKDINDVKECWSLNNLQPLWAKDNIAKSNKYKEK